MKFLENKKEEWQNISSDGAYKGRIKIYKQKLWIMVTLYMYYSY
jgi:hypothetical protein